MVHYNGIGARLARFVLAVIATQGKEEIDMNDTYIPRLHEPLPPRMLGLPRDERGYVVPRFVSWLKDGHLSLPSDTGAKPDFRVIDTGFWHSAIKHNRCWLCGGRLGANHVFTIGPMCAVNRITGEPGSHLDCAHYAVKVCPFMLQPNMRRNDRDVAGGAVAVNPGGIHNDRNPGVMLLWVAPPATPFEPHAGNAGILLRLGTPRNVEWWTKGRRATREEAKAALDAGVAELRKLAKKQQGAEAALDLMIPAAEAWLPAA